MDLAKPHASSANPYNTPWLTMWAISGIAWFLLALVVTGYYSSMELSSRLQLMGFGGFLMRLYLSFLPFALLSPPAFALCQRIYLVGNTRLHWLLAHIGLCLVWFVLTNSLSAPMDLAFWRGPEAVFLDVFVHIRLNQVLVITVSFWVIAVAATLSMALRERHQREAAVARLQAQLNQSRLQHLRDQLHPHFLFNSLNTAVSLIRTGATERAEDMLLALAELMDQALWPDLPLMRALSDELAQAEKILEIASLRFGDKLKVVVEVPADCWSVPVPTLLLQPLLENAVTHGVAARIEAAEIALKAHRADKRLHLQLTNNLPEQEEPNQGHGLGLSLTQTRLTEIYGTEASLAFGKEHGRFVVRLSLPTEVPP